MTATLFRPPQLTLNRRWWSFVLLVALLPLLGLRQSPAVAGPLRAQPELIALIAQHPEARVGVIVQKLAKDAPVETIVASLGGIVTKDLSIINAFAAELPAKAVASLARAAGVRWVSLDAPNVDTNTKPTTTCTDCVNTSNLKNAYVYAVGADKVWNTSPYLQGQGVGVAVVDSGVADPNMKITMNDFGIGKRVVASFKSNAATVNGNDRYGHGTHVAGVIGGDGYNSSGTHIGIAPKVNLINVKVSDDLGAGTASDVVSGLQWILQNKSTYNIRVVNISLNSSVNESYNTNPISAACEILWFNGIVVVVSAGNEGKNAMYPPANDPFVITVGATDDLGTASVSDDVVAKYSGAGTTELGAVKPEIVAPGTNIVSVNMSGSVLAKAYPGNVVTYGTAKSGADTYFRMSGTSMSAPVVSGAVALLLQDEPNLTPDQVKYRLMATALTNSTATKWSGYNSKAGAGLLNIPGAINGTTTESANTGIAASQLLWSGSEAVTWNSVNWNSVNWNSVNWNSVNWNSVNWNSVNWNSDHFGP